MGSYRHGGCLNLVRIIFLWCLAFNQYSLALQKAVFHWSLPFDQYWNLLQVYDVDEILDIFQKILPPLPGSSFWRTAKELEFPVYLFHSSQMGRVVFLIALKFPVLGFTLQHSYSWYLDSCFWECQYFLGSGKAVAINFCLKLWKILNFF